VLEEAMRRAGMEKNRARVAIQGFGNVGENAARLFFEGGYKVVAVSAIEGGSMNPAGLDIHEVMRHQKANGSLLDYKGSENITNEELLACDCDILVPAALSDQLHKGNAHDVKARIVLELANAPTTTNAGGVVVSYLEWSQNLNGSYWTEEKVVQKLKNIMVSSFNDVSSACSEIRCRMRKAAYHLAIKRVLDAE